MQLIDKTVAAFDLVIEDIRRLCRYIDVIVNLIFIGLYIYSIYTNMENPVLLTVNIVLLVISVGYFIVHATTYRSQSKSYKRLVNRILARIAKYTKMLIKVFTIGLSIYELTNIVYSDIKLISLIVAVVAFLVQIAFEVLRLLAERYFEIIKTGMQMDMQDFHVSPLGKTLERVVDGLQNPTATIVESITRPIKIFSGEEPEAAPVPVGAATRPAKPSKTEQRISERAGEHSEQRAKNKEEQQRKKEERKTKALRSLSQTLRGIFKPKDPP